MIQVQTCCFAGLWMKYKKLYQIVSILIASLQNWKQNKSNFSMYIRCAEINFTFLKANYGTENSVLL